MWQIAKWTGLILVLVVVAGLLFGFKVTIEHNYRNNAFYRDAHLREHLAQAEWFEGQIVRWPTEAETFRRFAVYHRAKIQELGGAFILAIDMHAELRADLTQEAIEDAVIRRLDVSIDRRIEELGLDPAARKVR